MIKEYKVKSKFFVIDTGHYKQDIIVCINKRSKEINKILDRYEGTSPLTENHAEGIDSKKPGTACFLFNRKNNHRVMVLFPRTAVELITLFDHEKIHCIHDVMQYIGMKLSDETEEAFAYLSEYLMKQFLEKA